jgi:hypothetical protein
VGSRAPSLSDESFRWETASAADYVSASGDIEFRVRGTRDGGLRTRTDLIRATVEF